MMNKKIEQAVNNQINAEIYSAYLYLAMAAYLEDLSLTGFSNWMKVQYQEEMAHAMKFYDFVYERGGKVKMQAIDEPQNDYKSVLEVFEKTLEHEKQVTASINSLYELAVKEKDYALESFLKWFIDEQVEEEASAQELIDKLKLAGQEGPGLFMLDKDLNARQFVSSQAEE
ncbi:ferritin [Candidatus Peregrinibacteria bacterium]|nr:ferritin [Candidatus Peregrinibacteria bacterium]